MADKIRKLIKKEILDLMKDLQSQARKCIEVDGIRYSAKLYGENIDRCCYSGKCPYQKLDSNYAKRPHCGLLNDRNDGNSS